MHLYFLSKECIYLRLISNDLWVTKQNIMMVASKSLLLGLGSKESNLFPHHFVQALCKVPYVVRIQAGHRNPSVCRQVYVELVDQCLRLRWTDSREAITPR